MKVEKEEVVLVTPGEELGSTSDVKAGKGAYVALHNYTVYASLAGFRCTIAPTPDSPDQRPTIEVIGHKAYGAVPEPGSIVLAQVTKVMTRMASADIMCVGPKSVREKFTGIIRKAALPLKPPFEYLLSHWDEMAGSGGQSGGPWV